MGTRQRMSAADAAWLHMDRATNLMVVNAVLWFDEAPDWDAVAKVVQERLVDRFPRFRQRVVEPRIPFGTPSWQDDDRFDLDRHLGHAVLRPPGDTAALQRFVGERMSERLDPRFPLWRLYLVEGYGRGAAVVARMHHAIADGIALTRVLLSLTDHTPDAGPSIVVDTPPPAGVRSWMRPFVGDRMRPTSLASALVADARAVNRILFTPPDWHSPLRGRNGVDKVARWTKPVPLAGLKAAARQRHATVNDVTIAALCGALRSYLIDRDQPVRNMRAMVPFNLRPADAPLDRGLGNRFGLVFLEMPVALADRDARIAAVKREMDRVKQSPEGPISAVVLGSVGMTAPRVEQVLVDFFAAKATAVLSNVPGPRAPVYLAGTRVAGVLGWNPRSGGMPLSVSAFSYAGDVVVAFSADAALVPDADGLVQACDHELEVLLAEDVAHRSRRRNALVTTRL